MSLPSLPVSEGVRLSEALSLGVAVSWHEAVALVRHCGTRLAEAPRGQRGVPPLDGITLRHGGVVDLATAAGDDRDLVQGLSSLLGAVLPPSSPEALRALTEVGGAEDTHLGKFIDALSFFARPDDLAELSALAERALEARTSHDRLAALQALTERARHLPTPPPAAPSPVRKSSRVKVIAALAVICLLGSAVAWAGWDRWGRKVMASTSDGKTNGPAQGVQSHLASALAFVKDALQGPPPAPPEGGDTIPASGPPQPQRRKSPGRVVPQASGTPSSLSAKADGAGSADHPQGPSAGEAMEPSEPPAIEGAEAPTQARVYSEVDPDVAPPALVRSQMPEMPIGGLPIERQGTLDLLVGEDGQVVSARLRAQTGRHQERMMVSAAKTWRFRPAMREGQPVQYRLEMPITW